jgi:hypothetical protein
MFLFTILPCRELPSVCCNLLTGFFDIRDWVSAQQSAEPVTITVEAANQGAEMTAIA